MPKVWLILFIAVAAIGGCEFGSLLSIIVSSFTVEVNLLTWLMMPTIPFSEMTDIFALTPSLEPRSMTSVLLPGSVVRLTTCA
ncbi:hypothetical protein D3C81_1741770 [compost metagenome]